jgi:adenine-specific DNA-methyltransferase
MTVINGLKVILKHNETAQPNDNLLNTLKAVFPQFFDKDDNFKADKFEDELKKNNIAEARDGYKLGFVGKDYARLQVGLKSETMIVPDYKHNSLPKNASSGNVFITGDNIDALRHLVNAYEKKIKLIYIDPPYNTGKEFVYSDKFEFSDEKLKSILGYSDEEIARLKSIQGKSSHSAWLTFMYPRLKIAQRLLKDNGIIFVSIDDNEQANLKLLMDDVFGEGNFVATFLWKKKGTTTNVEGVSVSSLTEYISCYKKDIKGYINNRIFLTNEREYPSKDAEGNYRTTIIEKKNDGDYARKTMEFHIRGFKPREGKRWQIGEKKARELEKLNRFIIEDGIVKLKIYDFEDKDTTSAYPNLLFEHGSTDGASKELRKFFHEKNIFDNTKPVPLIKQLLIFTESESKDDIILDFFAGSATTAHAVMQLNAEDGGNRKFIMVQIDEKTNPDSEARKAGYNTIDEIARKRIDLAGKKILVDYESDLIKQTNRWDKDIGFKHYRLVTPNVKTLEKIIEFNPEETNLIADDMIKPFEYQKTETSGLDTILTTWLIDDGYRFDTHVEEITFGNYKAHYVSEAITLYLINMGWDTKALKDMLNQIGINKLLVRTIVVYPYSFEFETMRELKTNIKTNLDNPPNLIERF